MGIRRSRNESIYLEVSLLNHMQRLYRGLMFDLLFVAKASYVRDFGRY